MTKAHEGVVRLRFQISQDRHIPGRIVEQKTFFIGHERARDIKASHFKVVVSNDNGRRELFKPKAAIRFPDEDGADMDVSVTQANGITHISTKDTQQAGIGDDARLAIHHAQSVIKRQRRV